MVHRAIGLSAYRTCVITVTVTNLGGLRTIGAYVMLITLQPPQLITRFIRNQGIN